jgi:putative transposase
MAPDGSERARLRLVEQMLALPADRLGEVEAFLTRLSDDAPVVREARPEVERDWPHAPLHRLSEQGTYMVTAATHDKAHFFRGPERLDHLEGKLLSLAKEWGWHLEAWAVFSNHYHFVAHSPPDPRTLSAFLQQLHYETAEHVNGLDGRSGRKVWFNYWDRRLTYEKSYLARLSYVHRNAVKHGLVAVANQYRWCSAAWLERTAPAAQVRTLYRFKVDRVKVDDDFDPV